jgi:hypothetical protein
MKLRINGFDYESKKDACELLGLSLYKLNKHIKEAKDKPYIAPERAAQLLKKWGKVLDFDSDHVKPIEDSNIRLNTAILLPAQEVWLTDDQMAERKKEASNIKINPAFLPAQ